MHTKNTALHGTSQCNVSASPWLSIAGNRRHTVTRYIKSELGFPPKTKTHSALVPYYCCQKGKSTISFTTAHDRTAISSRIHFSRGFRNDGSLFISHRNRGKAFMRHWVVPCRWTTGHHTDETGRRLYPIFDDDACIIVQLENAQSVPRIRPLRRTVTGWSAD